MMELDFILELLAAVRDLELLVGEETGLLLLLSLLLEDDEDDEVESEEYSANDEDEATISQRERRLEDPGNNPRPAHHSAPRLLLQILVFPGGSQV
ncbi:hypothetical protein ACFX1X_032871 [Malus domestica]